MLSSPNGLALQEMAMPQQAGATAAEPEPEPPQPAQPDATPGGAALSATFLDNSRGKGIAKRARADGKKARGAGKGCCSGKPADGAKSW